MTDRGSGFGSFFSGVKAAMTGEKAQATKRKGVQARCRKKTPRKAAKLTQTQSAGALRGAWTPPQGLGRAKIQQRQPRPHLLRQRP